jgi:hypothetical protein
LAVESPEEPGHGAVEELSEIGDEDTESLEG